jgi:hypothetical protein
MNVAHKLSLGSLTSMLGLSKSNLVEAAKLGLGAAGFPFVYGFLQSMLLKWSPMFAQKGPAEYGLRILAGLALGGVSRKYLGSSVGTGMVASAVGTVFQDVVAPMVNRSAAAANSAVNSAEAATGVSQMSGVNPLGRGLAGFGYGGDQSLLFGAGTPDLSGASMFGGATVAIEQGGSLNGATVAIEQAGFAGALM